MSKHTTPRKGVAPRKTGSHTEPMRGVAGRGKTGSHLKPDAKAPRSTGDHQTPHNATPKRGRPQPSAGKKTTRFNKTNPLR